MKICVYGAGAVGGLIAGRLARSGQEVSVVARGVHLEAIRAHGLRVRDAPSGEVEAQALRAEARRTTSLSRSRRRTFPR
jgi:2-dehydropantoate 2-reductase